MKQLQKDLEDWDRVEGNHALCACQTSECSCRIQSRDPAITRQLPKICEMERIGYAVTGPHLVIFAIPRTLSWVKRNIITPLTSQIPKENEGSKSGNDPETALETAEG